MTVQGNDIAIRGPAMRAQGFWRDETLLHHLARAVARSPDKTAIVACRSDLGFPISRLMIYRAAWPLPCVRMALGAVMWFPLNCRIGGNFPSCILPA